MRRMNHREASMESKETREKAKTAFQMSDDGDPSREASEEMARGGRI